MILKIGRILGIFEGTIGRIVLGLIVIASVLLVFSPLGRFICNVNPAFCEGLGSGWAAMGFIGIASTFATLIVLGVLFFVGDVTVEATSDIKWQIDRWYVKRQIARREAAAIEDNGVDQGQGLLEYALILMLVVIVVMIVLVILGPAVGNMFSNIVSNI